MKKTIILSATAFALMLGACNSSSNKSEQKKSPDSTTIQNANKILSDTTQTFKLDTTKLKSGASFYQCDMDPEVLSDKPGICPTCEMDLTEMKKH